MYLNLLLLLLLVAPASASGGVSIFLQNADFPVLGGCLLVLVFLTITFELFFHRIEHSVAGWAQGSRGGLAVIGKVTAELSVLGFISALVLVAVNLPGEKNEFLVHYIAVLEVAHLWLFFVGLMFVVEAIILLHAADSAPDSHQ